MPFYRPRRLAEALVIRAEQPAAIPLAGGTDVMVEVSSGRLHPTSILDLSGVPELTGWDRDGSSVRLGAVVSYARLLAELSRLAPGLATAARTIGSPQIRNRATIGGNLGTASPTGDALPPLLANGATVELASVRGTRQLPVEQFLAGEHTDPTPPGDNPRPTALAPDELICALRFPTATGPQQFAKVAARAAMAISTCSFALVLDPVHGRVGTGLGAVAATACRATTAEQFLTTALGTPEQWHTHPSLPVEVVDRFGELVAAAADPVDDLRGSAEYRQHALAVLARRTLHWAWGQFPRGAGL